MPTAYITAPPDVGAELADLLVEERLAACVNLVECRSTYRWDDEVHRDPEAILLAKTTEARFEDLVDRVEAEHPYDVPCIERFDEAQLLPRFARWRDDAVD